MSKYQKKSFLIGGLFAIVVVMAVAYAAFASNLTITGTGSTTNNWGVRIVSIEPTNPSVNATCTDTSDPSTCTTTGSISANKVDDLSATFSASLISPGDSVTYTITVQNYGGIDAKLDTITMPSSSNPAISFSRDGLDQGDVITAGESDTLTVTVAYVNSENQGQPASTSENFTLTLNFVQNDGNGGGGSTPAPSVPTYTFAGQTVELVDTGDGLYDNGDGTYTYKGEYPANYLSFEGNTWRILGIDSQGIKIISDEKIDLTGYSGVDANYTTAGRFDGKGLRDSTSNGAGGTYCSQSSHGCNAWAATENLVGDPAEFVNGSKSGTVLLDSELNTWLNGTYYTSTLNSNSNIIEGTYNVGAKGNESAYQWQGHIALLTDSEWAAAGGIGSYLEKSSSGWWLVSPYTNYYSIRYVYYFNGGSNGNYDADRPGGVRPVLYLSSNITLTGNGTNDSSIYTIQ